MCWEPIYIKGKEGFKEAVLTKLHARWLRGGTEGENNLLMFWLPKRGGLRGFKKAIGSKLIFRYRMDFFSNLEIHLNHINGRPVGFSDVENDQINSMIEWDSKQHRMTAQRTIPDQPPITASFSKKKLKSV